jgi:hypothetical protein
MLYNRCNPGKYLNKHTSKAVLLVIGPLVPSVLNGMKTEGGETWIFVKSYCITIETYEETSNSIEQSP